MNMKFLKKPTSVIVQVRVLRGRKYVTKSRTFYLSDHADPDKILEIIEFAFKKHHLEGK